MTVTDTMTSGPRAGGPRPRLEASSPRYGEKIIYALLVLCAIISVGTTTAIVVSLLFPTIDFFQEVSPVDFLTGRDWSPAFASGEFGVLPIVVGTLNVVFWALVVAIPVGLLSGIYLGEYASRRARKILKPVLEVLQGIPTVAIGIFALAFLRPHAEDVLPFIDWTGPFSVFIAGVAVGLMIVPLIASISDDAMRAVPGGLREGAYALGASKAKVALRVVFPAAISGIVAAIVLATSRAIGETMIVLIAAGATPQLTFGPAESVQTMTAFIGQTATGDIATGTLIYDTIFAVAALLFVMTLIMNMIAIRLVSRFREVYE